MLEQTHLHTFRHNLVVADKHNPLAHNTFHRVTHHISGGWNAYGGCHLVVLLVILLDAEDARQPIEQPVVPAKCLFVL